ncbi:MAG: peptide chain release factor N(5)-glutamine methyltransferase [Candidatus Bipolaricaulia bacterium]
MVSRTDQPLTARGALLWAARQLQQHGIESARWEAELITAHLLRVARDELYLHPHRVLTPLESSQLQSLMARRCRGEPLQYLLGYTEFFGCRLRVTPAVLIPRPETEELVELLVRSYSHAPQRVLDLGTGSGAIAIALARAWPTSSCVAVDISAEALALARENALQNSVDERICFLQSDWFSHVSGEFDLIVSNPPYVRTGYLQRAPRELHYEPRVALDGGADGLTAISRIIRESPRYLRPHGALYLEFAADQGEHVRELLMHSKSFEEIEIMRDLANKERFARAVRSSELCLS